MVSGEKKQKLLDMQAKFQEYFLKDADRFTVTSSGDPFASPIFRKLLQTLNYHIRFVGEDHKTSPLTGEDIPGHLDKVIYIPRKHGFSSTVMKYRAYWRAVQDKDGNTFYSPEGYEWSDVVSGNLFPKN